MMRLDWILSGATIMLEAVGFIIWNTFVGRLERWIWWTVWIGYAILLCHRLGEALGWRMLFGPVTSLAFGAVALIATVQTRYLLNKRDTARKRLILVQEKLIALKEAPPPNVAHQLAEVIGDLHDQIRYYEVQASDKGLPAYEKPLHSGERI